MIDLSSYQVAAPTRISRAKINDAFEAIETAINAIPVGGDSLFLNAADFGFLPSATAAVNGAALQAALNYMRDNAVLPYGVGNPYNGGGTLFIPKGIYNLDRAIDVQTTCTIMGEGAVVYGGGGSTILKWNDTSSGFRVQRVNTSGDSTYLGGNGGGDGTIFKDLWMDGGTTAAYNVSDVGKDYHGINFKARITCYNVFVRNWSGNGFHSHTVAGHAGALEGNSNNWQLIGCWAQNCRNGLFLDGADTNAGYSLGFNASGCRQWGIFDGSFLSNHHLAYHLDANGATQYSYVHASGHIYYCLVGQEAWCSANAPSGTTANNQGWIYFNEGGIGYAGADNWLNGRVYRAGGPICTDNANAHHVLSGYIEQGTAPAQLTIPTIVLSGHAGPLSDYGTTNAYGGYILAAEQGLHTPNNLKIGNNLKVAKNVNFFGAGSWSGGTQAFADTVSGLSLYGSGSSYDFTLGNSGGSSVCRVPTGTVNIDFQGNVGLASGKVLKVNGTQVVGAQGAAVADATGGSTVDTECRAQLNALLARMRAHGLIA